MIKNKYHNKKDYFLVYLLIFASSYTSDFSREWYLGPLLVNIFAGYFLLQKGKIFNRNYKNIIAVITIFFLAVFLLNGLINITYYLSMILRVTAAYLVLQYLGFKFFYILEDSIYRLALVSIPLFFLQLISFNLLFTVIKSINNLFPMLFFEGDNIATIFFFTLKKEAVFRNSGFMWEPGAFAAYLLLGMIFTLIYNNFKIDKRFSVLLIALLSTLSTMGYLVLILIFFFFIINNKGRGAIILLVPALLTLIYFSFYLDFVFKEVWDSINNMGNIKRFALSSWDYQFQSLGRFGSMAMDFYDLSDNPIFGTAGNFELMTNPLSSSSTINRTNGLSSYILTFGLTGFFLLIFNLNKTLTLVEKFFRFRGKTIIIIILLAISFSNSILDSVLILGFQVFFLTNQHYAFKKLN